MRESGDVPSSRFVGVAGFCGSLHNIIRPKIERFQQGCVCRERQEGRLTLKQQWEIDMVGSRDPRSERGRGTKKRGLDYSVDPSTTASQYTTYI